MAGKKKPSLTQEKMLVSHNVSSKGRSGSEYFLFLIIGKCTDIVEPLYQPDSVLDLSRIEGILQTAN